jgi:sugar lactone lactonase YvrE
VPKIVGWNVNEDRLERIIYLPPPVTRENSFINDLAVDTTHNAIFIAESGSPETPAILAVNLDTGYARRLLEGHTSVVPEDIDLVIEGSPVRRQAGEGKYVNARIPVNPIALDGKNEWLYFGPMSSHSLYRARTEDLLNPELSAEELGKRVERYSEKPICDGIALDNEGNIYISEVGAPAIGVIHADSKKYERLYQDEKLLRWQDSFAFGPDGYMYTVANQLHKTPGLNAGKSETKPPYYILRFKPLAPGVVGR